MAEQSRQLTTVERKHVKIKRVLFHPQLVEQYSLALPVGSLNGARMARLIFNEVQRNDKLADCTPQSIVAVGMACAQTGLEPGPTAQAWMIPYKNVATFQLSYRGMLTLAQNSEKIIGVSAGVVYENDEFDWDEGSDSFVKWRRAFKDRGERLCAFASLRTAGGGNIVRVMSEEEIEKHRRQYSKTKRDDAPWVTAWDEMACKTLLKKAAKWAPVSTETSKAMHWDGLAEAGKPQGLEFEVTVPRPECVVKCPHCGSRDDYPIPYDDLCTNECGATILVPADAEVDPETREMIPPAGPA